MRWSLKTTFLIVTVIALFLASKYNERNREVLAAKQIQHLGGEVSYQWQQPDVGSQTQRVSPAYRREIRYTVTLPDGTTETRMREEGYTIWAAVQVNKISHGSTQRPSPSLLNAIWPNNSDVIVEAVRINEADVNEKLLVPLRDLKNLKILQICRKRQYFRVLAATGAGYEHVKSNREDALKEHGEPFELAKALVQAELPDLNIIDGIVSE